MQASCCAVCTERMILIAGNAETVSAEISDHSLLSQLLNADVPEDWPPDLNDLAMKELSVRWFQEHPDGRGWLCWYFISLAEPRPVLIGIGGFSDVPDITGAVEIGYSVLQQYRRRGYATEAVGGLVKWAFQHPEVRRVRAEIYPGYEVSAHVLEKNGFRKCIPESQDGVTHYECLRE